MDKLISIIIPVYNTEKFLVTCLNSIIQQKVNFDYEIILIDDGSSDNSGRICDEYAEKWEFINVVHQGNKGQMFAREKGIQLSTGKYCMFIDSDDFIDDSSLESIKLKILGYSFPDLIVFNYQVYKQGQIIKRRLIEFEKIISNEEMIYAALFECGMMHSLCNKVISSKVLKKCSSNYLKHANYRWSEDAIHSLYIFDACETILFSDYTYYNYRKNSDSVFHRKINLSDLNMYWNKDLFNIMINFYYKWNANNEKYLRKIYRDALIRLVSIFANCFKAAPNKIEKRKVLEHNWELEIIENTNRFVEINKLPTKTKFYYFCMKKKLFFILYCAVYILDLFKNKK